MTVSEMTNAQEKHGAVFSPRPAFAPAAAHFGDPRAEYHAAKNNAAVFDLNDRTQIEVTGGDRIKFLHNFCTNDIQKLEPGTGCEAFFTNVKGRAVAHAFVFAGRDAHWIETSPQCEEPLLAHLERYIIADDVELHGRTEERGELFVAGPNAAELLDTLGIPVDLTSECAHLETQWNKTAALVRRADILGIPGFFVSVDEQHLAGAWQTLSESGIQPAGAEAFHALRIEAGFPIHGIDISGENLAQEVGRSKQAISFTKGCYLGQEPVARLDAMGHVNRALRGLRLVSGSVPEPGSPVLFADDGTPVGTISSAAFSFADGRPVALAVLRSSVMNPGTAVLVVSGDDSAQATVFWPHSLK